MRDDDTYIEDEPGEDEGGTPELLPGFDEPSDSQLSDDALEHIEEDEHDDPEP